MILIIGAMQEEVDALLRLSTGHQSMVFEGVTATLASLEGNSVLIARSGIGKVAAAYTTAILCTHFRPRLVINIGSAGGLREEESIGDIVVADCCCAHDYDLGETDAAAMNHKIPLDPQLVQVAESVLQEKDYPYHKGLIVSGDQFMTKEHPLYPGIQKRYPEAICVEMEASAIAYVCSLHRTPFLVLRSISDLIFREGNTSDFAAYLTLASKKSAEICQAMIRHVAKDQ